MNKRLFEIKRWHARAAQSVGDGAGLEATDTDAVIDDVGWLLGHVRHLQSLISVAKCPYCDGSGGYMTGDGHGVPAELEQCRWCDEKREINEHRSIESLK